MKLDYALAIIEVPGKGRGVAACRAFRAGDLIERAPCIVISPEEWAHIEPTRLYDYAFAWGPDGDMAAWGMGFASLYNHSYRPNARYVRREEERELDFIAIRDIGPGEEITVNYNCDPDDASPVWFEVKP